MNEVQYQLNSYIYNIKNKNNFDIEKYILESYDKFIERTKKWPISVTKEEFRVIIKQIYDVLKLKITIQETIASIESYLYFLGLNVTVGQVNIDNIWCVEKVPYLNWNISNETIRKIRDDIPFIQEKLYNSFKKKEPKVKTKKMFSSSF